MFTKYLSLVSLFHFGYYKERTKKIYTDRTHSFQIFFCRFSVELYEKKSMKDDRYKQIRSYLRSVVQKKVRLFGSKYEDKTFNDNTLMSY